MVDDNANITEAGLREAFKRSGLWRRGWTYERALKSPAALAGLKADVHAQQKTYHQQHGQPAPMQQTLI